MVLHISKSTRPIFRPAEHTAEDCSQSALVFVLLGGFFVWLYFFPESILTLQGFSPRSSAVILKKIKKVKYSTEALTRAVFFQHQLQEDTLPFYRAACTCRSDTLSLMHSTEAFREPQLGQGKTQLPSATDTGPNSSGLPFYSQK